MYDDYQKVFNEMSLSKDKLKDEIDYLDMNRYKELFDDLFKLYFRIVTL